jgi:hypothetical protein
VGVYRDFQVNFQGSRLCFTRRHDLLLFTRVLGVKSEYLLWVGAGWQSLNDSFMRMRAESTILWSTSKR